MMDRNEILEEAAKAVEEALLWRRGDDDPSYVALKAIRDLKVPDTVRDE